MDLVFELVKNIIDTDFKKLPKETIHITEKCILDTLGVLLAGTKQPGCKTVVDFLKEMSGKEESKIINYGGKVPSFNAALANATMARALDLDDVHEASGCHPSATMVPVAFAVAEKTGVINGKDLITSIVVGTDLTCRLRLAVKTYPGWVSETFSVFGATATAGKILELNEEEMVNAMGIAYSQAACNFQGFEDGALTPRLQQGFASKAGIISALLAQRGITGAKNVLQGRFGFYSLYYRNNYDPTIVTKNLSKKFEIDNVSIKPYTSCKHTHGPIWGVLELVNNYNISAQDIVEIKVGVSRYAYNLVCQPAEAKYKPRTVVDAQFSIPYTVACAIIKRDVFVDEISSEAITNPKVLKMAKKVKPFVDPEIDKIHSFVAPKSLAKIKTRDGKVYAKYTEDIKGSPRKPMSFEEVAKKFEKCTKYAIYPPSKEKIIKITKTVWELEKIVDVGKIVEAL